MDYLDDFDDNVGGGDVQPPEENEDENDDALAGYVPVIAQDVDDPDPTIASDVVLHSVYSGRGDALFLTWRDATGNPHMMMLDSGPYKYDAKGTDLAPYWRYLADAGLKIWATNFAGAPFALDLIIITHPHDDHIGGLMQMMSLAQNAFPIRCCIAICRYFGVAAHVNTLYKQAIARGWTAGRLSTVQQPNVVFPAGVLRKFPPADDVLVLEPPGGGGGNPIDQKAFKQLFNVARSGEVINNINFASILMKTRFVSNDGTRRFEIFTTGDNCGLNILPYTTVNHERKTFSIYKIQHHGSRFETAAYKPANATELAREETALLFTLLAHYRNHSTWVADNLPVYFKYILPKGDTTFEDATTYLVGQMKAIYKVADDDIVQNYVRPLLHRHNGYFNHIRHVGQGGAISPINTFGDLPETALTARDHPWDMWRALKNQVFNLVYIPLDKPKEYYKGPGTDRKPRDKKNKDKDKGKAEKRDKDKDREGRSKSRSSRDRDESNERDKSREAEKANDAQQRTLKKKDWREDKISLLFYKVAGEDDRKEGTPEPRATRHGAKPDTQEWWTIWSHTGDNGIWHRMYQDVLYANAAKQFFSTFWAASYVISANKRHQHPQPTAILGLSMALDYLDGNQESVLFITNARSFPLDDIEYLKVRCTNVAFAASTPLLGNRLLVNYLINDTFMSLDAGDNLATLNNEGRVARDLNGATQMMDLTNYNAIYEDLSHHLEHDLPIIPTYGGNRFFKIYTLQGQQAPFTKRYVTWGETLTKGVTFEVTSEVRAGQLFRMQARPLEGAEEYKARRRAFITISTVDATTGQETFEVKVVKQAYDERVNQRSYVLLWAGNPFWGSMAFVTQWNSVKLEYIMNDDTTNCVPLYFEESALPLAQPAQFDEMAMMTMPSLETAIQSLAVTTFNRNYAYEVGEEPIYTSSEVVVLPTLRDYLSQSTALVEGYTAGAALSAIVQQQNFDALDLSLKYQQAVLEYTVDPDLSTVDYKGNDLVRGFSQATVALKIPTDAVFGLGGENLPVKQAYLQVGWSLDLTLVIDFYVIVGNDNLIYSRRQISNVMGKPSLAKVLDSMGIPIATSSLMRLPQLLGVFIRSQERINYLLSSRIPTLFLTAGIAMIKPNLDRSTATISYLPNDEIIIDHTDVICHVTGDEDWKPTISAAGINLRIDNLIIRVNNTGAAERITLIGDAKFQTPGSTVKLSARYILDGEGDPDLLFMLQAGQSLDQLSKELPNAPLFGGLTVPMSKDVKLSSLKDGMSSIGFSIRQPVQKLSDYTLSSVFATVESNDWKEYLPADLVPKLLDGSSVKVVISNPTDAKRRTIAAAVRLKVPIPTAQQGVSKQVLLELSAAPFDAPQGYQYRVSMMTHDNKGISITEAIAALGLTSLSSDTLAAMPSLQSSVLDHLFIKALSVGVDHIGRKWDAADWVGEFWIDRLDLFPDSSVLFDDITISVGRTGELISCSGSATINLYEIAKVVNISFKPPLPSSKGTLFIEAPQAISVYDILTTLDLPSFRHVPILNGLLQTELWLARFEIGVDKDGKSWIIENGSCEIRLANSLVGILGLSDVELSVDFHRRTDAAGKTKTDFALAINANIFEGTTSVKIGYNSTHGSLGAILLPIQSVPLSRPISALLPKELADALNAMVGDLSLRDAGIVLATKRPYRLKVFRLYLADDNSLDVEFLRLKSLTLRYVAPHFSEINKDKDEGESEEQSDGGEANDIAPDGNENRAPVPPADAANLKKDEDPSNDPAKKDPPPAVPTHPGSLDVVGLVSKETTSAKVSVRFAGESAKQGKSLAVKLEPDKEGSLRVGGLLSLLGITDTMKLPVEEPPNSPSMFDIDIKHVIGKVVVEKDKATQKIHLNLDTFDILAESSGVLKILSNPSVKLDQVRANLHYQRTTKESGERFSAVSGFIEGHLQICGVHIWARYIRDQTKEQTYFTGLATVGQNGATRPQLDFTQIGTDVEIPSSEWVVPTDLKVRTDLKIFAIGANFIPQQCFEIFAHGNEPWTGNLGSVDIKIKSVTALVRRKTAIDPKTNVVKPLYEAFLKGELVFQNFVSTQAWLTLSKTRNSTLMAILTATNSDGKEIESLANGLVTGGSQDVKWNALVPTTDSPLAFDQSGIFLHVDFKKSDLYLFGNLREIGSALFITRKKAETDERNYMFILEARDLGKLWSSTSSEILPDFNVEKLSVQVISYNTTIEAFRRDLTLTKDNVDPEMTDKSLDDGKLPQGEPPASPKAAEDVVSVATATMADLPGSTPIHKGAWLFLTIALKSSDQRPMTELLNFGTEPTDRTRVTLYAAVTSDPKARNYSIDVRNLTLLGGAIDINGNGSYSPADSLVALQATLVLKGLGSGDIKFDVDLKKSKSLTHFHMGVGATSKDEVKEPFGTMFSATLKSLRISGDITYSEITKKTTSEYSLSGVAEFGRKKNTLSASVVFRESSPVAVVIQYLATDQLSLAAISSDIIQADDSKPISWDKNQYDDFELLGVTVVYVKSDPPVAVNDIPYSKGYSISATFKLFDHDFLALLKLEPERKGFSLDATALGEIDLIFAKLRTTGDMQGLTVGIKSIQGQPIAYTAKSGLVLFGQENLWFELAYKPAKEKKDRYFRGKAGYKGTILGKEDPTIDFTYKDGRWGFGGWEMFKDMDDKFPLAKAIEEGSKKDTSCGKLVDLVWKTVVKTEFRFELGLPIDETHKCTSEELWGSIKWWYNIKLLDQEIADLELPRIDIRVKAPFTLDALATKLFEIILDEKNWESIGASLMARPEDFARLMAAVAFEKLDEEIISRLVCRGKKYEDPDGNMRKRYKELNDKNIKDVMDKLAELTLESLAIGGGLTLGGILAGLGPLMLALPALPGIIGGILGGILALKIMASDDEDEKKRLRDAEAEGKRKLEELRRQTEKAKERLRNALKLSASPKAEMVEGENEAAMINVQWDESMPQWTDENGSSFDYQGFAGITWQVAYSPTPEVDEKVALMQETKKLTDTAHNPEWTFAKLVYVSVRAKFDMQGVKPAEWTTVAVKHTPWLRAPNGLAFGVAAADMACAINVPPTTQDVGFYELQLTNAEDSTAGKYLYMNRLVKSTVGPETIMIPLTEVGPDAKGHKSIQARLRQISSDTSVFHNSPWFCAPESYVVTQAVTKLAASLAKGRVKVEWEQPGSSSARDYALRVLREDGEVVSSPELQILSGQENERKVSFDGLPFAHGETITVVVQPASPPGNFLPLANSISVLILHPPVPAIDSATKYDVPSNSLTVVLTCNALITKTLQAGFRITSKLAGKGQQPITTDLQRSFDSVIARRGTVRLDLSKLAPTLNIADGTIVHELVAFTTNDTSTSNFSSSWRIPKVPSGLELGPVPTLVMGSDGSVRFGWPAGSRGARRLARLEHETDLTLFVEREWQSDEDGPTFVKEECRFLAVGMRVAVFRMTMADNLVGFKDRSWATIESR